MASPPQITSGLLTDGENRTNRCIIGDAILPQTGKKLTKNAVLDLALYCDFSDAAEKNRNIGTQQPQKHIGKLTSCMTFGAHKLVRSEPIWTPMRTLTIAVGAI